MVKENVLFRSWDSVLIVCKSHSERDQPPLAPGLHRPHKAHLGPTEAHSGPQITQTGLRQSYTTELNIAIGPLQFPEF